MDLNTYIFIGRSGCGKGTQVEKLAEHLTEQGIITVEHPWLRIETGAHFRKIVETGGYTAKMLKAGMEAGERLPDNFAIWTWTGFLFDKFTGNEHIFCDGCPRSLVEAKALDLLLKFYRRSKPIVFYIDVSREETKKRLLARGRADDQSEDIDRRLDWFDKDVLPAVEYYEQNPDYHFIRINGEQPIEDVSKDLLASLKV
ncbi:MAG: nucleoside monophosphate kinase [Candidatus Paceibacterota bacterium]|jgi:adenylate kinase family enzyme